MGPRTLLASRQADPNRLVLRLSQVQTDFYEASAAAMFRHGLIRRVALRTDAALAIAARGLSLAMHECHALGTWLGATLPALILFKELL